MADQKEEDNDSKPKGEEDTNQGVSGDQKLHVTGQVEIVV
jgi:hypothetical protein